ncbi:MAG: hypothetical protein RLZZ225_1048 [Pseudomonadota bacterium]
MDLIAKYFLILTQLRTKTHCVALNKLLRGVATAALSLRLNLKKDNKKNNYYN